jgi:hypothetical protein
MAKVKVAGKESNVAHVEIPKGCNDYKPFACELASLFADALSAARLCGGLFPRLGCGLPTLIALRKLPLTRVSRASGTDAKLGSPGPLPGPAVDQRARMFLLGFVD